VKACNGFASKHGANCRDAFKTEAGSRVAEDRVGHLEFCRLPEPLPATCSVDLDGDPFAGDLEIGGGHQYLFGFVDREGRKRISVSKRWAFDAQEEEEPLNGWLMR